MIKNRLHVMDLHEEYEYEKYFIMRVNGGWIYTFKKTNQSVFIPYSNEFYEGETERLDHKMDGT